MRYKSVFIEGQVRFGIEDNQGNLRLFEPDLNPLDLFESGVQEENFAETICPSPNCEAGVPLPVSSIRDFITFEQHTVGSLKSVVGSDEAPAAWFRAPAFYFTNPHAAIGSGADVPIPPGSERFDVELEVAAVISKDGYNLSVEEAWAHIGGLTIMNDWSARDLQSEEMQVGLGPAKGKDSATTLGPVVVTLDELEAYRVDDHFDMKMELRINDELIGSDSLSHMAWSFAQLVSYASRGAWVRRGDVIGSGTCGGGCLAELWGWNGAQVPPPLQIGDQVSMTVEGIGTISNTVVKGVEIHPIPPARKVDWVNPS